MKNAEKPPLRVRIRISLGWPVPERWNPWIAQKILGPSWVRRRVIGLLLGLALGFGLAYGVILPLLAPDGMAWWAHLIVAFAVVAIAAALGVRLAVPSRRVRWRTEGLRSLGFGPDGTPLAEGTDWRAPNPWRRTIWISFLVVMLLIATDVIVSILRQPAK
ncbi:MAG: hypothetical protein WDA71_13625 [Actinomycetota bacterium]